MGCGCTKLFADGSTQTSDALEASKHPSDQHDHLRVESICGDLTPRLRSRNRVYRVVLTGGPCAGKSTLLSLLQTKMENRLGVRVYTVPEAATMLVNGGMRWSDASSQAITTEYQLALLRVQLALEDQYAAIAHAAQAPALLVCDRGTMDGRAFCSEEQFNEILRRGGWSLESLRDDRYDAVIHMVSAAIGAESFYNLDNAARTETVEEARQTDMRLRRMYVGHPLVRVFDNSTSFEDKLERVVEFISGQLGNPSAPRTVLRRFLVEPLLDTDLANIVHVNVRLSINILNNSTPDRVMLVMKREQKSYSLHLFQKLIQAESGTKIRTEHRINAREYASLIAQRDSQRMEVVKRNVSFVWGDNYYEIGVFEAPAWARGRAVMYVESHTKPIFPPFVRILADITNEPCLSSYYVAHSTTGANFVDAATR